MTQKELRNTIVQLLYTYLDGPKVVLSDQVMPESDYPFIYYQGVQQHIAGPYNMAQAPAGDAIQKTRTEHAQASFSFTACSMNRTTPGGVQIMGDDEALDLADRAQGFFLFTGRQLLADRGIVVVSVENTQPRSALNIDEVARRYGFDILVRYERTDTRTVQTMDLPTTYIKEE